MRAETLGVQVVVHRAFLDRCLHHVDCKIADLWNLLLVVLLVMREEEVVRTQRRAHSPIEDHLHDVD